MTKPILLGIFGVGIAFIVKYVYETAGEADIFFRLAVTVLAGLYAGLLFLIFVLPALSEGIARFIYSDPIDKGKSAPMREAHALLAKGDYVGALEACRQEVVEDPLNRLAWLEMVKVQITHLHDAEGAVATLKEAIYGHAWQQDDAAFLMFKLAEVHLENVKDQDAAVEILREICVKFPESSHSAHATHQLREIGAV